jgi:hypothetical protein
MTIYLVEYLFIAFIKFLKLLATELFHNNKNATLTMVFQNLKSIPATERLLW